MEHLSESIQRVVYVVSVPDAYAVAYDILRRVGMFGKVIEHENRVFTTGPRTTAKLKFAVEHRFDKFTHLDTIFDINIDITDSTMTVIAEAVLRCVLPPSHGFMTQTFHDSYFSRLWPVHLQLAEEKAKTVIDYVQKQAQHAE